VTSGDLGLLATAAALVVLAGVFSAAEAALASFSRARAEELLASPPDIRTYSAIPVGGDKGAL